MTRLGFRLTLRSGREALVRLIVTALAVALGVAVLLAVFAEYHAFQVTSDRPSWETTEAATGGSRSRSHEELWNYSESLYQGRFIETVLVAPLGPHAPVMPGIPHLPPAGRFYASPALAQLLRTVPAGQLGARFPGTYGGTIGQAALSNPDELVAVVGMTRDRLASLPNTMTVDQISTSLESQGTTNVYRLAFGLGAIAVLFPLLILISTATRLSAARREERYAAIRLVGGTPGQISVIASVDAVIGAFLGTLLGIGLFLIARPFIADIALSGARFFPSYVTPTIWAYVAMIVVVPAAAAISSLISLRRVRISPLGVARKTTPPAPRAWRVIPLIVGIPLFLVPVLLHRNHPQQISGGPLFLGMLLIMVGLVLGGSWLTWQGARAMARWSRGSAALLASRRLEDDPKRAFRSVSGLVLAVFVGTTIAMVAPALNAAQSPTSAQSLTNVLRVQYADSFPPETARAIVVQLQSIPGAHVVPIYLNPGIKSAGPTPSGPSGTSGSPGGNADYDSIIPCSALRSLPAIGRCPAGAAAAYVNAFGLFTDNPLYVYRNLPLVGPRGPAAALDPAHLSLAALLVRTNGPATLERVRTTLTRIDETIPMGIKGESNLVSWQMEGLAPETFGEVAQIRNNDDANIEHVILALLGLTLLVAGCSLAVAVGGSLVERKRPFTLLRVGGAPESSLRRVVLLEAALPLLGAALVAAVVGAFIARPFIETLSSFSRNPVHVPYPSPVYFVTMVAGLVACLAVVLATLPLLGRITRPDAVRFE